MSKVITRINASNESYDIADIEARNQVAELNKKIGNSTTNNTVFSTIEENKKELDNKVEGIELKISELKIPFINVTELHSQKDLTDALNAQKNKTFENEEESNVINIEDWIGRIFRTDRDEE